mmetsp:Transcript_6517/g.23140  ORF Transcript_6517/g.23140 Transcript_6517/m.23140 type:complete len:266 (+) Transcript_6517:855-1652(+)
MHGVAMKKSTLAVSSSSIKKSGKLGIFLTPTTDGDKTAYAKFSDVTIADSGVHGIFMLGGVVESCGLEITGSGESGIVSKAGKLSLTKVMIGHNKMDGIAILDAGDGQGGCESEVREASVVRNGRFGVSAMGSCSCRLLKVKVESSGDGSGDGGHGVAALKGALVSVTECRIAHNKKCGVLVHGASPGGRASGVNLKKSVVQDNSLFGASAAEGGRLLISSSSFVRNTLGEVEGDYRVERGTLLPVLTVAAVSVLLYVFLRKSRT